MHYVALLPGDSTGGKRKRGAKAGGRSKQSHGLGVPVIATANDAYAPCLRPLRDVAAIYHFKPPGPDRLMSRLSAIAKAEQLVLDRQVRWSGPRHNVSVGFYVPVSVDLLT